MKKLIISILIACLAILGLASPVRAEPVPEMVTMDEALTVAQNWITLIIQLKGDWGGSKTAEVEEIQKFKRGERVLGYFCRVKPQGFIVISLRKELAPVKAYSDISDLDPVSDEGMADLIKGGMERILNAIEKQIGPVEFARTKDLENILEINYRPAWEELGGNPATFKQELGSGVIAMNYQEGNVLLSSLWHQMDPYNRQCPAPPSGHACTASHCAVGCVATAGAQVMRYWSWPPYRDPANPYDWRNMPDGLTTSSPLAQINAVARLCHEVGVEAGMDYCQGNGNPCASGACFASCWGKDLLDTFEDHFLYSTAADNEDRDDYTGVGWFNRMKAEFNLNRPVPYAGEDHAVVADGWREIGSVPIRQYHMNYGWQNTSYTTWYSLDALPDLGGEEEMLVNIYPASALGSSISGTYTRQFFPYRYFDQDATGSSATFEGGQNLQFLPNITAKCTSTTGGSIRFNGSSTHNTWLFTRGDRSRGVRIYNGTIKLYRNGSIRFH